MPMIEGTSNLTIRGCARLYEVHGNAVINHISDTNELKKFLSIVNLPRSQAGQKDYATWKKSGPCFPGTRRVLLRDMMDWVTGSSESKMYILSGLAGIGKSTVVYTLATRADEIGLLGASFFFSRDDDNRNNAKRFFSTIAYQLCVYNETFANTIGAALLTVRGSAATTQDPLEQLKVLILDPLKGVALSSAIPILVIVDALDECNEEDEHAVVMGLTQLVRILPSFKVILTTRPQPFSNHLFANHDDHKIFHLQDIEAKVVDSDIRLYLKYNLSLQQLENRYPRRQWCASNEEIDSLVRAAGRLFIIASTAVRYILDKSVSNPAAQIQKLLHASPQDQTPFQDLSHFYTVILQNVVPVNCVNNDIVSCYQSVVGTIVSVQRPLPVSTLAHLIDIDVKEMLAVLDNLQSVILLGSDDVPRIYHQSFPNYLTDRAQCKDPQLLIDTRIHHTQIASCCFEIMDRHLKYNILSLGESAQFMSNEDGLKEEKIKDEQLEERIPHHLRYACVYWINHLEAANIEGACIVNALTRFVDEHILHWFEVLSLIGKLDSAHRAILKLLKSTSSVSHQLLSDALRFIGRFYEIIERSALHTYHSALRLTPTDSLLYRQYNRKVVHSICGIEGGPEKWDTLVANPSHGGIVNVIKFSPDSSVFCSLSEQFADYDVQGRLKIWDAATGTPISTIAGHRFAAANNSPTVASFEDETVMFYNMNKSAKSTAFIAPLKIRRLVLSVSNRFVTALSDGTICLWDSTKAELIDSFDGPENNAYQLEFSPTGTRLAYSSNDTIRLRDGISGKLIADLQCGSGNGFVFSGNGTRIASLSQDCKSSHLKLWNSESGALIDAVTDAPDWCGLTISTNGSLLATANFFVGRVKLWCETRDSLAKIKVLEVNQPMWMTFSMDNVLAIATSRGIMRLYHAQTHSLIYKIPFGGEPTALAFSPDCTRLAVGKSDGSVYLWDIRGIDASSTFSMETSTAVTALALSRDCSRLACGFKDGGVELWGTTPTRRPIGALLLRIYRTFRSHTNTVRALAFTPDGRLFASGSADRTVKLWKGGDGSLRGTLRTDALGIAISNSVLVTITQGRKIQIWCLDMLRIIHACDSFAGILSISDNGFFVAFASRYRNDDIEVELLDVVKNTTVSIFRAPFDLIHKMTFLPDNSQLVVQSNDGDFQLFDLRNKDTMKSTMKRPKLEHLIQLPNTPLWRGVPIWHCRDNGQHYLSALFPQHQRPVPVLWIPRDLPVEKWAQGSSMIALGCRDGRVILLRLLTTGKRAN